MEMREKYIKWAAVFLFLSIITGAATYYLFNSYFFKANPFQHLTKPSQDAETSPQVRPFPDWENRIRQRALAVVIDNTAEARPQSGLDKRDSYRFPVEGGLAVCLPL